MATHPPELSVVIPAAFVVLAELPLLSSGKVDRRSLPAPEWQIAQSDYVAPRTPVEEVLAGIWAEVLGVSGGGWVGTERFDVMARPEHAAAESLGDPAKMTDQQRRTVRDQMGERLRALLADRFHLVPHVA